MDKTIRMVYCLVIDLIGSTNAGLELPNTVLDRFNLNLVSQLWPYLDSVGLKTAVIKFTGDGWLLMAEYPNQAEALCCLAVIMARRFQIEMSRKTGISTDTIPALRLAICSGRDLHVELPDKRSDWVGDSARRAVRASRHCFPNEILIDEATKYVVFRNFHTERIDINQRSSDDSTKSEESFALYSLGDLKADAGRDFEAPEYFINMLSIIGERKQAGAIAKRASEQLELEAKEPAADKAQLVLKINRILSSRLGFSKSTAILNRLKEAGLSPDIVTYNLLLRKAPDVSAVESLLKEMAEHGFKPDRFTYTMLISLSSGYDIARMWLEKMISEDITPDVVAYTAFIRKIPDSEYALAKTMLETMRGEGITPDIVTYTQLIRKAPNFEEIESLVTTIREEGLEPDKITYKALISRVPNVAKAKQLLKEMSEKGLHHEFITFDISRDYNVTGAWVEALLEEGIQPDVIAFAELINNAPDYAHAKAWLELMMQKGISPHLSIYNILIRRAPDFEEAQSWMNRIREDGLRPDQTTYRRLIRKSPTFISARRILLEMRGEGITTKPYIYRLIIGKSLTYEARKEMLDEMQKYDVKRSGGIYLELVLASPSYDESQIWIEAMLKDGVFKVGPYCALFRKDMSDKLAENILGWYLQQDYHPQEPIQAAIASFVRAGKIDQALRLALDYPHLAVARKLIRLHGSDALSYFKGVYDNDAENPNASYALGLALMELGRGAEAEPYLRRALKLAKRGNPRRKFLNEWLHQIEKKGTSETAG